MQISNYAAIVVRSLNVDFSSLSLCFQKTCGVFFLKWEYTLQGLWTANKDHGPLFGASLLYLAHWGSVFAAGGNRNTQRVAECDNQQKLMLNRWVFKLQDKFL